MMIEAHLGRPDAVKPPPTGQLRQPVRLYACERVHALEDGAARSDLEKLSEGRALARRALALKKQKMTR